jgi:hypothetical protein
MNTADPTDRLTQRHLWNARLEKRKRERAQAARRAATAPAAGSYASSCDLSKDLEIDSAASKTAISDTVQETPMSSDDGASAAAERAVAVFSTPISRFVDPAYAISSVATARTAAQPFARAHTRAGHASGRCRHGLAWASATIVAVILAALVVHVTGVLGGHATSAPRARAAVSTSQHWSTKPLQATLAGVVSGAESIGRDALAQQRREAAAATKARARVRARRAAERRRAAASRRTRHDHSQSGAAKPRVTVSTTTTQSIDQPATSGEQTSTTPQTTTPASGSTSSSNPPATSTSSGSSTHTHAFGQGGVLGVGHAG